MKNIFDDEFSPDDVLEETRSTREEILEKDLPSEDSDLPTNDKHLPIDHPLTDSGIDAHEKYDEDF